jgi:glyoxylase-like metal-dependent hydrolase (beta-lactamase superfamily II)
MVKIKKFMVGPLGTNCYLVYDFQNQAILIDPGFEDKKIDNFIKNNHLLVKYILLTHAHFDHVGAALFYKNLTKAKIAMHKEEVDILKKFSGMRANMFGYKVELFEPDLLLADGQELKVGEMEIKVIHTPGHSSGGLSFYLPKEKIVFSGDTLFCQGVGRTDLPGSNEEALWNSIIKKLLVLPDETKVLPGHGSETIMKNEHQLK